MRRITTSFFAIALLASGPLHAVVNSFLCMPQVPGETFQSIAAGCIEVGSFSEAAFVEGNATESRDMRFTKYLDIASFPLRRAMVNGTHFSEATFRQYKTTGQAQPELYMYVKMGDVTVTSFSVDSNEDGSSYENVSFSAVKIEYMYKRQNATNGQLMQPVYMCWDRTRGSATNTQCP